MGVFRVPVELKNWQNRFLPEDQRMELPQMTEPLLGALPLEEMDWHVSPRERKLLPNPKSPDEALLPLLQAGLAPRR